MDNKEFSLERFSGIAALDIWKGLKYLNEMYRKGTPVVSDMHYDSLVRLAKQRFPERDWVAIGAAPEGVGETVKLEFVMGSLRNYHYYSDKTTESYDSADDVDLWAARNCGRTGMVQMDKIDGVSILATWINGIFDHAELRGDEGVVGTNITKKARHFLPLRLPENHGTSKVVLRGEITFTKAKEHGYKNRRNSTSGVLHRIDDDRHADLLDVYFYEVVSMEPHNPVHLTHFSDSLLFIRDVLQLKTVWYRLIPAAGISMIGQLLTARFLAYDRAEYDIDGGVICSNEYAREDDKLPKGKIAFKPASELHTTTVNEVRIQVSRLGRMQPVVFYTPVEINGATCIKATGFNYGFMEKNTLGVGSTVAVTRAQEVVPKIETVINGINFILPTNCPDCNYPLEWDESHVHLICNGPACSAQLIRHAAHFFITLGMEEFSESSFEKLVTGLNITSFSQFFHQSVATISALDGFGVSKAKSYMEQLDKIMKNTKPDVFLAALGIPLLGKTLSRVLVARFEWDDIIHGKLTASQLNGLDGVADIKADKVVTGIRLSQYLIQEILPYFNIQKKEKVVSGLNGKTFCITGSLNTMKRPQAEKWIMENGGEVGGIKNIPGMYLVSNETTDSSKSIKARTLGIPIITEEQLYAMVKS